MVIELRLLAVALFGALLAFLLGQFILPVLRRLGVRQTPREEGPASHLKKTGTPAMGGIIFLSALVITVLIFVPASNRPMALAWLWLVYGLAVVGFMDDYVKVVKKQSLGLRAREKLLGQVLVTGVFYGMLKILDLPTTLAFPGGRLELGVFYLPFLLFFIMGSSNGANLTDGVDGLLTVTAMVAALAYLVIGLVTGVETVSVMCAALLGVLAGFLPFNWHPARVFMGDVGSLALGGALAGFAIFSKTELLLALVGIILVIETLSLIIQVVYFRRTGGKRFFRMAPIHHHFELCDWSELRIVRAWCIVGALGGVVALLLLPSLGSF